MTDPEKFNEKMKAQKENIDESIKKADQDKGLVVVLTGNGKGKSSSAFGMVARSVGYGMKVGVCQFIKGDDKKSGEFLLQRNYNVEWHIMGNGFTWDTQDYEKDKETARKGWEVAKHMLSEPMYEVVVLDELTYLLKYDWVDVHEVISALYKRPEGQHVIITGRGAPQELLDAADTVTVMQDKKHAYRAGIKAQKGIDL